jgi:hypothetical protein
VKFSEFACVYTPAERACPREEHMLGLYKALSHPHASAKVVVTDAEALRRAGPPGRLLVSLKKSRKIMRLF